LGTPGDLFLELPLRVEELGLRLLHRFLDRGALLRVEGDVARVPHDELGREEVLGDRVQRGSLSPHGGCQRENGEQDEGQTMS